MSQTTQLTTITATSTKKHSKKEASSDFPRFSTPEEEEADERLWAEQFANSEDYLAQLVAEAHDANRQGLLLPLETIFDD